MERAGRRVLWLAAIACLLAPAPAAAQLADPAFRLETVARLEFPVGLEFAPSGDLLFVNERAGRVRLVRGGRLEPEPVAVIETATAGEQGLLGLALHPEFERGEPWVYVFHTLPDGSANRVTRLRWDGRRAVERETVLDRLPAAGIHNGGALAFGPDGKLYVTHGETGEQERARDRRRPGGKIYRVNPDGSVPGDNPFPGAMTWSYGHRNPFGIAFDPVTDNVWESENGPAGHDEVNLIEPGRDYGWPEVMGKGGAPRFADPVVDYEQTIVPTMMAFAGDAFPPSHRGDLFLGSCAPGYCRGGAVRRLVLGEDRRTVVREEVFLRLGEGVVGMTWGPDGLYLTTPTRVLRLRARAGASPSPPAASPTALASPPGDEDGGVSAWTWIALGLGAAAAGVALFSLRRWGPRR